MKIGAKMYKIWKYFEKGQVIVYNNCMQYTARIGPGTIRFIRLSNNLMNFSHPSYFTVTIISNIFSDSLDLLLTRWNDDQTFFLCLSLFLHLWQIESTMSSMGMAGFSWPPPAKSSSIHVTFYYSTLNNTCQIIVLTYWC